MTSLEMVEYINNEREETSPKLLHNDFMDKIPKVFKKDIVGMKEITFAFIKQPMPKPDKPEPKKGKDGCEYMRPQTF